MDEYYKISKPALERAMQILIQLRYDQVGQLMQMLRSAEHLEGPIRDDHPNPEPQPKST